MLRAEDLKLGEALGGEDLRQLAVRGTELLPRDEECFAFPADVGVVTRVEVPAHICALAAAEETFAAHAFLPFFLLGERVRRRRRLVSGKVSSPGAGAAVMSVASVMIA